MKQDWLFSGENYICNFRTAGILIRNHKILVQREKNGTEYALPGGHVKIGETSEETLIREYKEETGADIICNRLIWIEETFWKWGNKNAHGVAFYYLIALKDDSEIPDNSVASQKDNCNIILEWVSIEQMKQLVIYPSFIKNKMEHLADGIEHFVSFE